MADVLTHVDTAPTRLKGWLRDAWGEAWAAAGGVLLEALVRLTASAVLARYPGYAPDDGLALISDERGIERGSGETRGSFIARLRRAFATSATIGTSWGMEQELRAVGFTGAKVLEAKDLSPDGGTWARFLVFIGAPHPFVTGERWDDPGLWDDPGVWVDLTPEAALDVIRRIVRHMRAPHARCTGIAVPYSGELWDYPVGAWDDAGGTWDATIAFVGGD